MANEATLVIKYSEPISIPCIDVNEKFEKGALLKLIDPFTLSGGGTLTDGVCGGIAAVEKVKGQGTQGSIYRSGIFKMTLSGACLMGDALAMASAANKVYAAITVSGGGVAGGNGINLVGDALEAGADAETILVDLKPRKQVTIQL